MKSSLLLIFVASALTMAGGSKPPAKPKQDFYEFLMSWEKSEGPLQRLQSRTSVPSDPVEFLRPNSPELADFSATVPGLARWQVLNLPRSFWMPDAPQTKRLDNKFLLAALNKDSETLGYLRMVRTTTGCQSGCAPVVFALMLDKSGAVQHVHESSAEPLLKIYHQRFTEEDKSRLVEIAKLTPQAIDEVPTPSDLANHQSWPPQTYTFAKPWVVEGAAYTTSRVVEAAMQVQEYLSTSQIDPIDFNPSPKKDYLDRCRKWLNDKNQQTRAGARTVRQVCKKSIVAIIEWAAINAQSSDLLREFLRQPWMATSHLALLCRSHLRIAEHPEAMEELLRMPSVQDNRCGDKDILTTVSKAYRGEAIANAGIGNTKLGPQASKSLLARLDPAAIGDRAALALELEDAQVPVEVAAELQSAVSALRAARIKAIRQEVAAKRLVKAIPYTLQNLTSKRLPTKEPMILISIAPSCPKCQELANFVKTLPEDLRKKIFWIDLESLDSFRTTAFCQDFLGGSCDQISGFKPERIEAGRKTLSSWGQAVTPHVFGVTPSKGIEFSFEIDGSLKGPKLRELLIALKDALNVKGL